MARKFCVVTIEHSGATSLMKYLERFDDIALPGKNIECEDNELINVSRYSTHINAYNALCEREIDGQQELIEAFYALNDSYAYAGFVAMPEQLVDYDAFIQRDDVQFIVLGRKDIVSLTASFLYAMTNSPWRFNATHDSDQVRSTILRICQNYAQLMRAPHAIRLYYEDLCNPDYASGEMDAFFNRSIRLENPAPLLNGADHISNWDEFRGFVEQSWRQTLTQARQSVVATAEKTSVGGTSSVQAEATQSAAGSIAQKRILYAWEMGMDLGHVLRFLPLGMKLRDRGYDVVCAVRDMNSAESAACTYGFPVIQAPIWLNFSRDKQQTLNYSDIILCFGFQDARKLKGLVLAWRHLFEYTGADMVIADYSPVALLAVRTLKLKCATLGTGFTIPPRRHPAPCMRYWVKVSQDKLLMSDKIVLANANSVIADLGGEPLRSVSDLFKVDEEFITSFKELDHYANRGAAHYWGPGFNIDEGETLAWPDGDGQKVFVYLKPDYPDYRKLLELLSKLPARVLAYTPRIPDNLRKQYQSAHLHISLKPLRLSALLSECDLVVSHAGNGTVSATLLAGIPQLLLPTQLEQRMLSRRVVELGAGLLVEPFEAGVREEGKHGKAPDYARLINDLLKKTKYRNAARAFAKKYAGFSQERQINLMADRVGEIVRG